MALPPRHPDPLEPDAFLAEMKGSVDGTFVLGSFNRYITVHSQQVRAVNLIHCLKEKHGTMAGRKIAVIGAGFGGVTAAAYALEQTNAEVTIFESAPRALWIQDHCLERWLHPGLYDWPLPGSLEPRTYLPVMNWRANRAHDVVAQVREQWDELRSRKANLSCFFDTTVAAMERAGSTVRLGLHHSATDGGTYDVVIVAVGFGIEDGAAAQPSYWNDVDGLTRVAGSVLISGFGDGGLADLLRLSLPGYRQDRLLELVRDVADDTAAAIVETERALAGNVVALNDFYEKLRVASVIEKFGGQPRDSPRITIVGNGQLYGTTSAILNRFLVSQLKKARPQAFAVLEGRVKSDEIQRTPKGYRAPIVGKEGTGEQVFDHVILRHGPKPALENIAGIGNSDHLDERRRGWRRLPQVLDRTRVPLFEQPGRLDELPAELRALPSYESSGDPWCLVIAPQASDTWPALAQIALNTVQQPLANEAEPMQIANRPLCVRAEDAVSSADHLRATVRAICSADVLIADVTEFDNPAVMLLLGIRACVRRGVSITCTAEPVTMQFWSKVPFNIREVKLVSLVEPERRVLDLANAIRDGLAQLELQPGYLDLPVYEYIRQAQLSDLPGPSGAPPATGTPVLWLRSFSDNYRKTRQESVRGNLEYAFSKSLGQRTRLFSILDEASPRLAGQRLYAAIRRQELCVVDWSDWKPNVFFELGARLASHPTLPLSLLDKKPPESADARSRLVKLLVPHVYERPEERPQFIRIVEQYLDSKGALKNHAFEVASQFFESRQERYRERVDHALSEQARATVKDGDPLESVEVDVLYADGARDLARQVTRSSFEQLCAAWCYLDEREAPHEWKESALLDPAALTTLNRYRSLGARLGLALETRRSDSDRRLLERIRGREQALTGLAALADSLNEWRQIRLDIDRGTLPPDERTDTSLKLKQLKDALERVGGRASVMLRQALDHDLGVLT